MADLTITAASVAQSTGADTVDGLAGETITAGMSVYLNASNVWMKAQCDGTAIEAGSGGVRNFGIALHASLSGQPLKVQVGGIITIGATVAVGTDYVIATTAGGIAPRTDLASTNKITHLGFADTTTTINMASKRYYGVAVP